jgi:two-component system, sensor histidine kinase PdtaS
MFGYEDDELIGSPVDLLVPDSLRTRHADRRAEYAHNPRTRLMGADLELQARRKDGTLFPVEISLSHVPHNGDSITAAFISDITVRKQYETERQQLITKLEGLLSEKTVLIKEVHHRVKNNLAVIASLLGMQARRIGGTARTAFDESRQRVLSMALIHEYLYANERLGRVHFGQYIKRLSEAVSATYSVTPNLITVRIEAEELELAVHRAIPCGLIMNELISNAFRYAYPMGDPWRCCFLPPPPVFQIINNVITTFNQPFTDRP